MLFRVIFFAALVQVPLAKSLPSGTSSAEGVACDLARSFINRDPKLFRACVVPADDPGDKEYRKFLEAVVKGMAAEKAKTSPSPGGPKVIKKLYKARNLSKNGPSSYAYAVMDYVDLKFVDIKVELHNGQTSITRTLLLKGSSGRWYAHPRPDLVPMLSTGLNQESPSTIEWTPPKKG